MDASQAAVFAELIQSPVPDAKNPISRYRVSLELIGDSKLGETIDVPLNVHLPVGSIHLFMKDHELGSWKNQSGVSSQMRRFLESTAKLPTIDQTSRLEETERRLLAPDGVSIARRRAVASPLKSHVENQLVSQANVSRRVVDCC